MFERAAGELETKRRRRTIGLVELCQHGVVIRRRHDDQDVLEVFRGGTDKAWAADVDLLDQIPERNAGLGGGLHECVEVDHDEVNQADAVLSG